MVVGTTDVPVPEPELEPEALDEEVEFLLEHSSKMFARTLSRHDVRSVFVGIWPLVRRAGSDSTQSVSRRHELIVSRSGLVTMTGGKWTIYRKMAEDAVNAAVTVAGLPDGPCRTHGRKLHGSAVKHGDRRNGGVYGTDAIGIDELIEVEPQWDRRIHPRLSLREVEVI